MDDNIQESSVIIKTNIDIGIFIQNSFIDKVPVRQVTKKELECLSPEDYILIDNKPMTLEEIEEVHERIKNLKNKKKEE